MTTWQAIVTIAIIAGGTIITRFLPFWLFHGRSIPGTVIYLGKVLPYAVIGMLVVYCLKGVSFGDAPHGLPEALGILVTGGLFIWRRNTLLSILVGTIAYMCMIQFLFVIP